MTTAHDSATETKNRIAALEVATPQRDLLMDGLYRLLRNRASVVGLIIIAIFVLGALFANFLAPFSPIQINSGKGFLPPAFVEVGPNGYKSDPAFLFGTDTLGRDVLSRTLYGARVSMVVGFVPTFIILIVGTVIGLISGYRGGWVDNLLMRVTDVVYAFPDLLFFIIMMITLRDTFIGQMLNGLFLLFSSLAIVSWVGVARVVRGQVLSLKEKEFIEAARCIGARDSRIMFRHILPNSLGPIIIISAMTVPGMIITEAILGYLGLGLRPSTNPKDFFITSWGSLLLEGQTAINAQPWLLLLPAICVSLIVLAFTFVGDGLRDALDPRLQGTQ
ncbi:ABC transporter permease [Levilinea saccharolytica]|uniref:ABC transporter permease n=1 Tax=Levilinea saccharolytica TaxID=229921 RepID=A0A0M8JS05_9CHLR|nr:ABC transporter permease [Levilinea saccharolytica]KPL80903.1 ABC transporter permease [Levilinea saccharolytica]GAP19325.1 ABC-type dipeptide/oligopeptide/nickel transport system, permease component [Levilinea saccharolytica]